MTLHITAHFSGLRYIMFHWPILSAAIGICTNLFFIMIVSLLSWYHWGDYVWIEDAREIFRNTVSRRRRNRGEYSTSIDESNKILDDDDVISLADDQKAYSNRSGDSSVDNKFGNLNSSSKC